MNRPARAPRATLARPGWADGLLAPGNGVSAEAGRLDHVFKISAALSIGKAGREPAIGLCRPVWRASAAFARTGSDGPDPAYRPALRQQQKPYRPAIGERLRPSGIVSRHLAGGKYARQNRIAETTAGHKSLQAIFLLDQGSRRYVVDTHDRVGPPVVKVLPATEDSARLTPCLIGCNAAQRTRMRHSVGFRSVLVGLVFAESVAYAGSAAGSATPAEKHKVMRWSSSRPPGIVETGPPHHPT